MKKGCGQSNGPAVGILIKVCKFTWLSKTTYLNVKDCILKLGIPYFEIKLRRKIKRTKSKAIMLCAYTRPCAFA